MRLEEMIRNRESTRHVDVPIETWTKPTGDQKRILKANGLPPEMAIQWVQPETTDIEANP